MLGLKKRHRDDDSILSESYGLHPIGTFSIADSNHIPVSVEYFMLAYKLALTLLKYSMLFSSHRWF